MYGTIAVHYSLKLVSKPVLPKRLMSCSYSWHTGSSSSSVYSETSSKADSNNGSLSGVTSLFSRTWQISSSSLSSSLPSAVQGAFAGEGILCLPDSRARDLESSEAFRRCFFTKSFNIMDCSGLLSPGRCFFCLFGEEDKFRTSLATGSSDGVTSLALFLETAGGGVSMRRFLAARRLGALDANGRLAGSLSVWERPTVGFLTRNMTTRLQKSGENTPQVVTLND